MTTQYDVKLVRTKVVLAIVAIGIAAGLLIYGALSEGGFIEVAKAAINGATHTIP